MSLATDDGGSARPSQQSQQIFALREQVIAEWLTLARAHVPGAAQLQEPILADTMPTLYDNIAQALSPQFTRPDATSSTSLAIEHGNERARMTEFGPDQLIQEYQLFRKVFFGVMHREGVCLSHEQVVEVHASIDTAVMEAVASFTLAHAQFRQNYIATLAHDLRTPLGTVSMAAQVISRVADTEQVKLLAEKIKANTDRADEMIRELLDLAALYSSEKLRLQLSEFDMLELAREVVGEAAPTAVNCNVSGQSVAGHWCRLSLKRSVENLLGNAMKYGAPNGAIGLNVASTHGRVLVSVHNEGRTIPASQIHELFQMFKRSDHASVLGWGLGLPYVKNVAESHGGSVLIDSAPERGTTVTMNIPIDARPFALAGTTPAPGAP